MIKANLVKYKNLIYKTIAGSSLFILFLLAFIHFSDLPSFEDLENPKYDLASNIYDAKGVAFGRYYVEDRVALPYEDISIHVKNALIATEDHRFYSHCGVDVRALMRVGFKRLLFNQESAGGGSTITQQLAKLLYKRPNMKGKSWVSKSYTLLHTKLKEWVIAIKLEKSYTKEEIMSMYLNKFEFINGAHGIEAATQIYFNTTQDSITIPQAATLVGMLKNPSLYNPNRFPDKCKKRRDVVLQLMYDQGYIDKNALQNFISNPVDMSFFNRKTQSEGPAPYFRAELTKWVKNLLEKENITKSDGSEYNIYTDGLKIYTTIDLTYQNYAEQAVHEHMKSNQERFWRVWNNRDPWTFEADDFQKKLRKDILQSQIKDSERYLHLRSKIMDGVLSSIAEKYSDIPMSDNVIEVLDSIAKQKFTWRQASTAGIISETHQDRYHRLINDSLWQNVMEDYSLLQKKYTVEFTTPVKMKVFTYDGGEKEVEMTPIDSVRYHKMFLQAGFMAAEPHTGYVKAWVGGVDHRYFKFDHATMRRSVGSTIKPFVYTQAMAVANISPCQEYDDIQYTIAPGDAGFHVNQEWTPANATETFTGNKYNLFHGLLYSKNSITVRLIKEMGSVAPIRDLLHNVGIDKNMRLPNGQLAVPELPSICLGAVDLTLQEMVGAYTAFSNNGTYVQPIFVSRIEDKNGKVIYNGIPNRKSAINPLFNAVMVSMLKNNVGGRFAMGIKSKIGGKTGTTNDYTDAWFMSITPTLVTGVWTGGDDKWIRYLTLDQGEGYRVARPISVKFFQKLENDPNCGYDWKADFPPPPKGYTDLVNCEKYKYISPSEERRTLLKAKLKREEFDDEFQ